MGEEKRGPDWVAHFEDALGSYYGEPVMPVSRYCNAFREWAAALGEHVADDKGEPEDFRDKNIAEIVNVLPTLELAISKSSLLYRMIYAGESRRSRKCPVHKGRWTGLPMRDEPCGCDLTGWLREDFDPAPSPPNPEQQRAMRRVG